MIPKLSVPTIAGLMMGVWFLSSSFAAYVAGWIAGLMAIESDDGVSLGGLESLVIYTNIFEKLAIVAIFSGVILFLISPKIVKVMDSK